MFVSTEKLALQLKKKQDTFSSFEITSSGKTLKNLGIRIKLYYWTLFGGLLHGKYEEIFSAFFVPLHT